MKRFSLERFDEECREVLRRAQERAESLHHGTVALSHFLLMSLSTDAGRELALDHDLDLAQLRVNLTRSLADRAKVTRDQPAVHRDLLQVLQTALDATPYGLEVSLAEVLAELVLDERGRSLLGVSAETPARQGGPNRFRVGHYNTDCRAALQRAQDLAGRLKHSHVLVDHFLITALDDQGVQERLESLGVDWRAIGRACVDEIEVLPKVDQDQVFVGHTLLAIIRDADEAALQSPTLLDLTERLLRARQQLPKSHQLAQQFLTNLVDGSSELSVADWFDQFESSINSAGFLRDQQTQQRILAWAQRPQSERVRLNLGSPDPVSFAKQYRRVYGSAPPNWLREIYARCDGLVLEFHGSDGSAHVKPLIASQGLLWDEIVDQAPSPGWASQLVDWCGPYFPLTMTHAPERRGSGAIVDRRGRVLLIEDLLYAQFEVIQLATSIPVWLTLLQDHDFNVFAALYPEVAT